MRWTWRRTVSSQWPHRPQRGSRCSCPVPTGSASAASSTCFRGRASPTPPRITPDPSATSSSGRWRHPCARSAPTSCRRTVSPSPAKSARATSSGRRGLSCPTGGGFAIAGEAVTIGRLPECAIVLRDANVSRRHAQIRLEDDGVVLRDLGSTNGTRVNDVPVKERRLRNGDRISVGNTTMVLETG